MKNIIKSHGDLSDKRRGRDFWIDLNKVFKIYKGYEDSEGTFFIAIVAGSYGLKEEFETEKERDDRFKDLFFKWSGKTYLEEVKN